MSDLESDTDDFSPNSPPSTFSPTSPIAMTHVAFWRNQISSFWSSRPNQKDGHLLKNARTILVHCRDMLESVLTSSELKSVMDTDHANTPLPTSALLVQTHRDVSFQELDTMPFGRRQTCLSIRGTDLNAIPLYVAERRAPTMAHIRINKTATIELHMLSDGRLLVNTTSQKLTKQHIIILNDDDELKTTCHRLFQLPDHVAPPDEIPVVAKIYNTNLANNNNNTDIQYVELPSWLSQRVGQVLQDGFRLHVLLTAATTTANTTRAVVIDKAVLNLPTQRNRGCQLVVRLHKTSGVCICSAHQNPASPGTDDADSRVQIVFSFCGHAYPSAHNRRCMRHPECESNHAPELPVCCLHNFYAKTTCHHAGLNRPYTVPMEIPVDSVERIRIIAAAAVALVHKNKKEALSIKQAVDAVFNVGEACEKPDSATNINKDLLALQLLRNGGVERTVRAGVSSLSAKTTNKLSTSLTKIAKTHGHLFKKRKGT